MVNIRDSLSGIQGGDKVVGWIEAAVRNREMLSDRQVTTTPGRKMDEAREYLGNSTIMMIRRAYNTMRIALPASEDDINFLLKALAEANQGNKGLADLKSSDLQGLYTSFLMQHDKFTPISLRSALDDPSAGR